MLIVFFRAIILYIVIIFCIRLMGKKQLGELQPSELVVTILLSNIATLPIEDINIPVIMGLIPIITIVCLDVFFSYFSLRSRKFRRILCGSPKIIISNGKLDQSVMKQLRYTIDDLFESLREQGVFDISKVQLAIVETTGNISVYQKPAEQAVTANDMGIKKECEDPPILVVDDGEIVEGSLKSLGVNRKWLDKTLSAEKCTLKDTFIMTCDRSLNCNIIKRKVK